MNSLVAIVVISVISIVNAEMKPCCMKSNTYTAGMQISTATLKPGSTEPTVTYNTLLMNQDSARMMTRFDGHIDTYMGDNATQTNYSVVSNYATGKEYSFGIYEGQKYCNIKDIDTNMSSVYCVPSNLMFDDSFMFGSGSEGVMVNSWSGMVDGMMWSIQMTMSDCTPVAYNKFGMNQDGSRVIESVLFGDVKYDSFGMQDPFMVPAQCMNMDLHLNSMFG